jgi:hypothetical protein
MWDASAPSDSTTPCRCGAIDVDHFKAPSTSVNVLAGLRQMLELGKHKPGNGFIKSAGPEA